MIGRFAGLTGGLALLLALLLVAGLQIGFAPISFPEVLAGLFGDPETDKVALIVQELRLPRLLVGLVVGGSLGLSGAALQGLLRNPLADPGVIGVSASAGFGAVVAIHFGMAALSIYAIPVFAMAGALLATGALYILARRDTSVLTLILVGIGINSLAGALISLAMNLAPSPYSLSDMVLWLLGSLSNRSMTDFYLALPFMAAGWLLLMLAAPGLRSLTLGEEAAATLGLDLRRARLLVVFGTSLAVGAGVAVTGVVGFVGLIVPHMLRPFVGYDPSRPLVPSALGGAVLVLLADCVLRVLPGQEELKLGVVTALIGGPFFLYLVIRTRRQMR